LTEWTMNGEASYLLPTKMFGRDEYRSQVIILLTRTKYGHDLHITVKGIEPLNPNLWTVRLIVHNPSR